MGGSGGVGSGLPSASPSGFKFQKWARYELLSFSKLFGLKNSKKICGCEKVLYICSENVCVFGIVLCQ